MERVKTFTAPTGSTVKAIPAPPIGKLTDYLDYGIACTETSGQSGNYEVTLDDTESKEWLIFIGTSNPTSWDDWYWKFSFDEGPLVEQYDTATLIDTFNRFAVSGSGSPSVVSTDIGLAVGTGNSRVWTWTVSGDTVTLARVDVSGTVRWRIARGSAIYSGSTDTPIGTYTGVTNATGTVAVGKKQIAQKAWQSIMSELAEIRAATDLLGIGRTILSSVVSPAGTIDGPIIIGDDYLDADGRAFKWYIDPAEHAIGGYVVTFTGSRNNVNAWSVTGTLATETVGGAEKWLLKFELPRAITSTLRHNRHIFAVKMTRSSVVTTVAFGTVLVQTTT